jgi:copper chaperone NosL
MESLRPAIRLVLALAALSLVAAFFLPVWQIQLWAPQYPEGLNMKIWLTRITGDVDIINGLNHYIGMKSIKAEMFPEFKFMHLINGALIVVGLLPAFTGRRRWLHVFALILCLCGVLAMADFYVWGYNYGHNLNPKAAISVPGLSYEPPLFGYKNLLNFVAYSGPDSGGWVVIGVGVIAVGLALWEQWFAALFLRAKK